MSRVKPSVALETRAEFERMKRRWVTEAFERDSYMKQTVSGEERDYSAVAVAAASELGDYRVASKKDRYKDAIKFRVLVGKVFPSTPGPGVFEEYEDDDERIQARETWKGLVKAISDLYSQGRLQKAVRQMYGQVRVLRAKLHNTDNEPMDVMYLTSDLGCLQQDGHMPANKKVAAELERAEELQTEDIELFPEYGPRIKKYFSRFQREALGTAEKHMQLMIDMNPNGDGSEEEPDDDGDE
jgi:hypothetical protein